MNNITYMYRVGCIHPMCRMISDDSRIEHILKIILLCHCSFIVHAAWDIRLYHWHYSKRDVAWLWRSSLITNKFLYFAHLYTIVIDIHRYNPLVCAPVYEKAFDSIILQLPIGLPHATIIIMTFVPKAGILHKTLHYMQPLGYIHVHNINIPIVCSFI